MANNRKANKEGLVIFLSVLILSMILIIRLLSLYISEGVINTNYRDPEIQSEYFRGSIYDRNGNILAMDRTSYVIKINSERVSEVSRLSSIIAPYTSMSALTLENAIRLGGKLEITSSIMLSEQEDFKQMLQRERLDHLVSLEEKRERIYPLSEHGRIVIGREGEKSKFAAEGVYDEILDPPFTLTEALSTGKDITLSLSQRIEYIADHIVSSYVTESDEDYLMLSLLDYSTGEIYALSVSSGKEEDIDFDAIETALSGRPYTILKTEREKNIPTPEDTKKENNGRHVNIHYRSGFALVASSSDKEMMDSSLREFEAMLSL